MIDRVAVLLVAAILSNWFGDEALEIIFRRELSCGRLARKSLGSLGTDLLIT